MKTYRNDAPYIEYLIKKDPKLEVIFKKTEKIEFEITNDYFNFFVRTIVFQQLSGKVATVIFNRLSSLLKNQVTPGMILAASFDDLRACGLSARKISYIQNLAELVTAGEVDFTDIDIMTNEKIAEMVTKIKGIGPWSAEMFLMFALGRDDVFSSSDLGLATALKKIYDQDLNQKEIETISKKWIPYRSVVAHFLWHYNE